MSRSVMMMNCCEGVRARPLIASHSAGSSHRTPRSIRETSRKLSLPSSLPILANGLTTRRRSSLARPRAESTPQYGSNVRASNSSSPQGGDPSPNVLQDLPRQDGSFSAESHPTSSTSHTKDGGKSSSAKGLKLALKSIPTSRRALLATAASATAGAALTPGLVAFADEPAQIDLPSPPPPPTPILTESPTPPALSSPALATLASRVSTFSLPNGMRWIVLERHAAPIVACHTYADVGASDEEDGNTGIAHLLEHLAFKGTPQVGTLEPRKEAVILNQLDEVFYELREAKANPNTPSNKVASLQEKFEKLKSAAGAVTVPNEYGSILSREGAVGLNAVTSQDSTEYYVSLPANKLELWMALESGRFLSPVFRELYSEKEVVKEERRLRIDNSPYGKASEEFVAMAFQGQPYGRPTIGYPADLERIGRREVEAFFAKHYSPRSLCCAVVGDVDPEEVERLALKYFGQWVPQEGAVDPAPWGATWRTSDGWDGLATNSGSSQLVSPAKELRVRLNANPLYLEGYLRPDSSSTDDPTVSVLNALLSGSRSSRFYKNLILPGRVLSASANESYPGDKFSTLFLLTAFPALGSSTDQAARVVQDELRKMAEVGPTDAELDRVKKSMQVSFLGALGSNGALAGAMCSFVARSGSWDSLLKEQEQMMSVTSSDIQRVASKLFGQTPHFALHGNKI